MTNLIKITCLLYLFFDDALKSINIQCWVMSCNLSFIFEHPIIAK